MRIPKDRIRATPVSDPSDPRRAPRLAEREMVVEYWDGVPPEGRGIRDISESGAYIYTTEKWYSGAIMRLMFHNRKATPAISVVVRAQVVRQGKDGFAMEFLFSSVRDREQFRKFLASVPALVKKAPEASPAASVPAPPSIPG